MNFKKSAVLVLAAILQCESGFAIPGSSAERHSIELEEGTRRDKAARAAQAEIDYERRLRETARIQNYPDMKFQEDMGKSLKYIGPEIKHRQDEINAFKRIIKNGPNSLNTAAEIRQIQARLTRAEAELGKLLDQRSNLSKSFQASKGMRGSARTSLLAGIAFVAGAATAAKSYGHGTPGSLHTSSNNEINQAEVGEILGSIKAQGSK